MQNLDKSKFEQTFAELPAKRMKVLRMLLAGQTDSAIAQSLNIEPGTVRTQIAQICKAFGLNDSSGERRSRRADLMTVFAKYKPELVGEKSKPFDSEPEADETATKVISNSYSDRTGENINRTGGNITGENIHFRTPKSPKSDDTQTRFFTLVLSGTVNEVDRARAEAIIAHLKNVVGDVEMTLEEIKPGSILLVLNSSTEDIEVVEWMFKTGQIPELLGFPVLDVRLGTVSEVAIVPNSVNLSQWLQNVIQRPGWQTLEEFLQTQQSGLEFCFRPADVVKSTRVAKMIDFGMQPVNRRVGLVISRTPESNKKVGIMLQIHPVDRQNYLPPNIQLIVLDEEEIFLMAESRQADNWIQLEFSGEAGEPFSIKVALDNTSFTENFVI
ncbi:DUF1822 family protein [Microcoleus sp. herbarium14]|uniref:DUF1822 family protein n=1 Tax=Microcoleus sp. herbarium14 TaxID=3055439 RepID=UPI002FD53769